MHEDGVGWPAPSKPSSGRRADQPIGVRSGFFAWVDGARRRAIGLPWAQSLFWPRKPTPGEVGEEGENG